MPCSHASSLDRRKHLEANERLFSRGRETQPFSTGLARDRIRKLADLPGADRRHLWDGTRVTETMSRLDDATVERVGVVFRSVYIERPSGLLHHVIVRVPIVVKIARLPKHWSQPERP